MEKEFIALNAGDPDVEAPQYAINEALIGIVEGGVNTHYPHFSEFPDKFKEAVVDYYNRFTGVKYDTKNVIPAAGSSAALYVALASTLKHGDEVLLFNPYYSGHKRIFAGMGIKMNLIPLLKENNYHPDIDVIGDYITPKTRGVLICNPANPTGTVFNAEELKALGDHSVDNDMAIIADEIYLHYVYGDNKFVSIAGLHDDYKERTIGVMSFSKTFSMTGWRLGYDIVPDKYLEKATLIHSMTAPRPATFVYRAGIACLRGDYKYIEERRVEYEKRRNYFCKAIDDLGYPCHMFEGAFYAWFDISSSGLNADEYNKLLQEQQNVRLSPGSGFGHNTDHFMRVPLVRPVPVLKDVINRIKEFKASL